MPFRFAANAVMVLHHAFIAFALFGGFLLSWWPGLVWLHLPVLIWAVAIAAIGWTCPLTPLENKWRVAGGGRAYEGGFIEHYITARFYPEGLPRPVLASLGLFTFGINCLAYSYWLRPA